MDLRELIRALENSRLSGDAQVEIKDIQSDSRQVTAGSLFVAVRGTAVDGHDYIICRCTVICWSYSIRCSENQTSIEWR